MLAMVAICLAVGAPTEGVTLRTQYLEWALTTAGRTARFVDRKTGRDYAEKNSPTAFAVAKVGEAYVPCASAAMVSGRIVFRFDGAASAVTATLRPTSTGGVLILDLEEVTGDPEGIRFGLASLTLRGDPAEPFAACSLARNLRTNVLPLPGPSRELQAIAYRRLGFAGASVAVVAGPRSVFRKILQRAVKASPDLPQSPIGGPWALDSQPNRRSYLFNFAGLNVAASGPWIDLAHALGAGQIDFHGGTSFRFGDFLPNPETYPGGIADLKATVDALHAAGLQAGLHTYAFFIDKRSKYVTPVPDKRLAAARSFTLAEPIDDSADTITVVESTKGVNATTGFFVTNSATLRLGDELVTFQSATQEPPWRFIGCKRGALGTRAASHAGGTRADHLKELFGLFLPDVQSDLFIEVIENTARTYNECGFDMIYLDALDGSYIHEGPEWAWYHGGRFVYELVKRLKKPAIMEMSTFHHHLWCVRARMGAWDAARTGYKEFVDMHRVVNRDCERMFLPSHLGWWGVWGWNGIQPDRTLPDDLEYLLCKALADDAGVSFVQGFSPDSFPKSPGAQRYAAIIRRYEDMRKSGAVPAVLRKALGVPGAEFTLVDGPKGKRAFVPTRFSKHDVDGEQGAWTVQNPYGAQPLAVRIEAKLSIGDPAPGTAPLLTAADTPSLQTRCAEGVTLQPPAVVERPSDGTQGAPSGGIRLAATSARKESHGAWVMVDHVFPTPIDMTRKGMGVWIHGDGKGELLNFQLRNADNVSPGVAEHYVVVDFTGWKYVTLIEQECDRLSRYTWPYAARRSDWETNPGLAFGSAYKTYHPWVNYSVVYALSVWLNELPAGGSVECVIGPVTPLPLVPGRIIKPQVGVAGKSLSFPCTLESGQYLELGPSGVATIVGPENEIVGTVRPDGTAPVLPPGETRLTFACRHGDGPGPRARVTAILSGKPRRF